MATTEDTAHVLMQRVLPLMEERWVDGARIRAVVDQVQIRDIEARIYFLRELLGIIRRIPLKVYPDGESRTRLIDACQEALDAAIEEEEDELG